MKTDEKHIIAAVAFSQFVTPFMFSGVGVTLPAIGNQLMASGVQLGLVESIYMGTSAAILLPMGKLADLTEKKSIFKYGLFFYALFSFLLGLSTTIQMMLVLRLLQGVAAAMLLPTGMAILTELVPREHLGRAIGMAIGSVYFGLSSGPFVAGILTTHLSWRYVYFVGAGLIALAYLLTLRYLPKGRPFRLVRIDLLGSLAIIFAIAFLIGGSATLHKSGIGVYLMILGFAFLFLFCWLEIKVRDPLVDLQMIAKNKIFSRAVIVQFFNYAGTFGVTLLFSLYLQSIKEMTPQHAGFVLMISPVLMAIFAPYFGRLSDRIAPSIIAFCGMVSCTIASFFALSISESSAMLPIYFLFIFMGLGFSMFSSPNMNIIMSSVEKENLSIAAAIAAKMRTLGMVISLIIINTWLSVFIGQEMITRANSANYMKAMHSSLLLFCLLMIAGIWFSLHSLKKHGNR